MALALADTFSTLSKSTDSTDRNSPNSKKRPRDVEPLIFGQKRFHREGKESGIFPDGYEVQFFQHSGKKNYQEDRLVVYSSLSNHIKGSKMKFFAIFDGHGGKVTSEYLEAHFLESLVDELKKDETLCLPPKAGINLKDRQSKVKAALLRCIERTEKDIQALIDLSDGSTAVVCLFDGQMVTTANVGDSRAVLARVGKGRTRIKSLQLSKDHTAGTPEEAKRIRKAGGIVANGRLWLPRQKKQINVTVGDFMQTVTVSEERSLEVSRSFGDPTFKKEGGVICVPNFSKFRITERDKFMILACDGLFEVWENKELVEFINHKLFNDRTKPSLEEVMKALIKETILHRFAKDNTSVILIVFPRQKASTTG